MNNSAEIFADLKILLSKFEGREYSGVIHSETRFFADLGFASIDAVVLGEELQKKYGPNIPFNAFLADAAERNAEDIRVGELAEFLAKHLQQHS